MLEVILVSDEGGRAFQFENDELQAFLTGTAEGIQLVSLTALGGGRPPVTADKPAKPAGKTAGPSTVRAPIPEKK